ncbi:hypothetical protein TRAPUB_468 [Trametes pubescens]|uniref:Uncharacterized protein n=1 Tax=Trametes pubescens TaxID=154538 RepID=A0A1M2VLY9_TRAPU|nr:hypothetical protein TRAPUB_468 [Trametes pubescens]
MSSFRFALSVQTVAMCRFPNVIKSMSRVTTVRGTAECMAQRLASMKRTIERPPSVADSRKNSTPNLVLAVITLCKLDLPHRVLSVSGITVPNHTLTTHRCPFLASLFRQSDE